MRKLTDAGSLQVPPRTQAGPWDRGADGAVTGRREWERRPSRPRRARREWSSGGNERRSAERMSRNAGPTASSHELRARSDLLGPPEIAGDCRTTNEKSRSRTWGSAEK